MIKINLLGVTQAPVTQKGPPPTVMRQVLIFAISAVVSALVVLFFWRIWSTEIADLNKKKAEQLREAERLAQIRAENQRYLAQRQQLERRINTIQQLQQSRVGPVDLMINLANVVNRANDLYLLSVNPEGTRVSIRGQSSSVHSIANFIADLKNSGSFQNVQLRQYYQDDQYDRLSFKFNLDCEYKLPPAAPPAGAGQSAAGPAAPGRPAGL